MKWKQLTFSWSVSAALLLLLLCLTCVIFFKTMHCRKLHLFSCLVNTLILLLGICACLFIWALVNAPVHFFSSYFKLQRSEKERLSNIIYFEPKSTHDIAASNDVDFRASFSELWDRANPNIGPDFVEDPQKFMIYACRREMGLCAGWGDRVKGMLLGYLMANLTGRVFKIDFGIPACDVTKFLAPNRVDWSLAKSFHTRIDPKKLPPNTVILDYVGVDKSHFEGIDFSKIIDRSIKFVYMKGNWDYMSEFQRNPVYARQLAWMKGLRKDQIFSELYRNLFRPSPTVMDRIQQTLHQHLPSRQHKLVCAHVRMGLNNGSTFMHEPVRMQPQYLPNVWKFISGHSTTDRHKVFLMSDSVDALSEAKRQRFGSRLITTPGPILHIQTGRGKKDALCDAIEKIVFDQAILMNCDVLLISHSALSRMAAFVRGSDEGLYCLFHEGTIEKCRADEFTQLYGLMG